jgi:hypothetical protein
MIPPSSPAYRFLACLGPAHGFPVLRLLRRLRPLIMSSPVSAASSAPNTERLIKVPMFRLLTLCPVGGVL